jgi:hypothetical protein
VNQMRVPVLPRLSGLQFSFRSPKSGLHKPDSRWYSLAASYFCVRVTHPSYDVVYLDSGLFGPWPGFASDRIGCDERHCNFCHFSGFDKRSHETHVANASE